MKKPAWQRKAVRGRRDERHKKDGLLMELYAMEYVLALAEYRNFTLAAEACHIGQPALSQQIARVEKELGIPLFQRSTHGVSLTEAGSAYVERAREILQRSNALEAEMNRYAGLEKGVLNLGIIASLQCIGYGEMISAFCRLYPDIFINITQNGTHPLLEALQDRRLDAVLVNKPVRRLAKSIRFEKLGEDRYALAVPAGHPFAEKESISVRELARENLIFHSSSQVAAELCLSACRRAGFEPNIICRSASPTTTLYMVQGGLGLAFLPSEEFESHAIGGIRQIRVKEPIVKEVGIAWRSDNASPLVDALVRFACKRTGQ